MSMQPPFPPKPPLRRPVLSAPRMTKDQVKVRVGKFKRWIFVSALIAFAAVSGLAAEHSFAATASVNTSNDQQDSGGFFNQGGGNNIGGNSGNGPVTSSGTS